MKIKPLSEPGFNSQEVQGKMSYNRSNPNKIVYNYLHLHLDLKYLIRKTMYLRNQPSSINAENFILPNQIQLDQNNRWVVMANLIPWQEFEEEYADIFNEKLGAPAKPFRMALGALIIQQKLKITDRETVEQIQENPYLQYFIG